MSLIEITDLNHRYQGVTVLEAPLIGIEPGSITGLSGPNGSGKSTLINIMGLIIRPTCGTVRFMGAPVHPFSRSGRLGIVSLPQESRLLKRTVYENVAYGLKIRKDTKEIGKRISEALEMVGMNPTDYLGRQDYELSGGESKRIALAARLVLRPKVLLLDEPTAHVDDLSCRLIQKAVRRARDRWETTLVIASHDREWLSSICDSEMSLFKGRVFRDDRINLLTGPWIEVNGIWYKNGDSSTAPVFRVPGPATPNETAILPASALFICDETSPVPDQAVVFHALVNGLYLNPNKNVLFVSLTAHGIPLVAITHTSSFPRIIPGDIVRAYYLTRDIIFR
jgi:tungstate transport system ATP-binding protein